MMVGLTQVQQIDMQLFKTAAKSEAIEESVQQRICPQLIAALHWRESSAGFNTYLHQGTSGPSSRQCPQQYTGVLRMGRSQNAKHGVSQKSSERFGDYARHSKPKCIGNYTETYNGLGYFQRGVPVPMSILEQINTCRKMYQMGDIKQAQLISRLVSCRYSVHLMPYKHHKTCLKRYQCRLCVSSQWLKVLRKGIMD